MTIHPPLPEQSWPPAVSAYCLKPVTFFFPMRLYPSLVSNVPCPIAGCSQRTQLKGHSRPRWAYSLQQTELLVCSVHYCRAHSKEFNAVDAIPRMPEIVGSTFPFVVTTSAAVTKECVLEWDALFSFLCFAGFYNCADLGFPAQASPHFRPSCSSSIMTSTTLGPWRTIVPLSGSSSLCLLQSPPSNNFPCFRRLLMMRLADKVCSA